MLFGGLRTILDIDLCGEYLRSRHPARVAAHVTAHAHIFFAVASRAAAAVASLAATALGLHGLAPAARARDLASYVNPFQGTATTLPDRGTGGSAGNTFPGAVAPHGMVQWSPDTIPGTENSAGGYSYGDHELRGFSLTHMSGAGCANLQDFPILPTTTPVTPGRARILRR